MSSTSDFSFMIACQRRWHITVAHGSARRSGTRGASPRRRAGRRAGRPTVTRGKDCGRRRSTSGDCDRRPWRRCLDGNWRPWLARRTMVAHTPCAGLAAAGLRGQHRTEKGSD
jgi:hypothetical protein